MTKGTFCREGEFWTVAYEGKVARFRAVKGFDFLAQLLWQPGRKVFALELTGQSSLAYSDGAAAERARVNVTRAIRSALRRIEEHHPALASHLDATVRTGTYCSYLPDPRAPISWNVAGLAAALPSSAPAPDGEQISAGSKLSALRHKSAPARCAAATTDTPDTDALLENSAGI